MIIAVNTGEFIVGPEIKDTGYTAINQPTSLKNVPAVKVGAELRIAFRAINAPSPPGPVARVSLVQIVQDNVVVTTPNGATLTQQNIGVDFLEVHDGTADEGARIDQDLFHGKPPRLVNIDPRYAQCRLSAQDKLVVQDPKVGKPKVEPGISGELTTFGSAGYAGERTGQSFSLAMLRDRPTLLRRTPPGQADTATGGMDFEIGVLFEKCGDMQPCWGGSITWGFTLAQGAAVLTPLAVASAGSVSPRFAKAVQVWNNATVTDPVSLTQVQLLPLP